MKFVFISLAVLVVLAVVYTIVKFVCVCAYQYASGVVEEYFDAVEQESTQEGEPLGFMDENFIATAKAEYYELLYSKNPYVWLARTLYF
jgi:hypothetical protein